FNKPVKSAKWASSDKKIAAVSQKGVVKGVAKGSAVVAAKVGKKVYKCKVSVESPKISLSKATVKAGKTFTLKLNGTKRTPKWYTSDKKIATVGANGVVKTLRPGTVNVFTRLGGKNFVCKLTVTKADSGTLKSLKYKMVTKKFDYKTSSGILFYTNEITYPYFLGSSQVDKKFNLYYSKKVKQYSKADINELEKQYGYENGYNNYMLSCLPFYQKTYAEVKYNKNGYISILEAVTDWAGGAHPYTSYNGMTFRISDGKLMKYDDIVRGTDYEKSLLAIMTVKKENLSEGYGIYENDEWIEYTPFVLTNKGLVFYYYMGGSVSGLPLTMPYSSSTTPIINAKKSTDILSKEIEKINNSRIDLAQYLNCDIDVAAKKIGGLKKINDEFGYVEY
ncbi:MAG: Ig-like domain-containing protein, partial [Clostridia bacterium]|nr:Ig-like domain-containing protein [Clostridia bacterium]